MIVAQCNSRLATNWTTRNGRLYCRVQPERGSTGASTHFRYISINNKLTELKLRNKLISTYLPIQKLFAWLLGRELWSVFSFSHHSDQLGDIVAIAIDTRLWIRKFTWHPTAVDQDYVAASVQNSYYYLFILNVRKYLTLCPQLGTAWWPNSR